MKNFKRFLSLFLILVILTPLFFTTNVRATNGGAVIYSRDTLDSDGNTISWDGRGATNTFMDKNNNYLNLYCMDAGLGRSTKDQPIDEKYITSLLKIDDVSKFNIFESENAFNSFIWFTDNMYLWQYNSNLSNVEKKALKEENFKSIREIILSQKDYLKEEYGIDITEEWLNNTMFQIINIDKYEDTLVELNKIIIWNLVKNTITDETSAKVNLYKNFPIEHMKVKHEYPEGVYYTECDGNILCLWNDKSEHGNKHFNFYDTAEENKNFQNALKAYYFGMLNAAKQHADYNRFEYMSIDTKNAKTDLEANKIGPFVLNNYNEKYINNYSLIINEKEISKNSYSLDIADNGTFYIVLDETLLNKVGNYNIKLDLNYNYGIYRDLYLIGNEDAGHQPLLSVNYNTTPITDGNTILIETFINEKTIETKEEYPSLKVTKTVDKNVVSEGDEVTYTIIVENTGNVDLENVIVTDEMLELNSTIEKLEVGKSQTITKKYTITSEDIKLENGIKNTVYATTTYKGNEVSDSDTTVIVPKIIEVVEKEVIKEVEKEYPSLKVTKTVDKNVVSEGDEVTYTIVVENTGNVELTNILIEDEMLNIEQTIEKLEVGDKETITKKYTITSEDIKLENGIKNTVYATTTYKEKEISDSDSTVVVPKIIEVVEKEVEKEVIKVVEKEVEVPVEKIVYKTDTSTADKTIPKTGIKYMTFCFVLLSIITLVSYIFYKKNKIY